MKSRWQWVLICVAVGLLLLGCGLLVPVHLRAVDSSVVLSAGRKGDSLLERGKALSDAGRLGAAQMLATAAQITQMPGWDRLRDEVKNRAAQNPSALYWGTDPAKNLFKSDPGDESISGFIIHRENREAVLARLNNSPNYGVQELMQWRALNRTILFPAASAPGGQALDAVLSECGLLLDDNHVKTGLSENIQEQATQAVRGNNSQRLEQILADIGSLGEHFNWDQLTALVAEIPDSIALHQVAAQISVADGQIPVLFGAMELSGDPGAVARYVAKFPKTGMPDVSASLWYGGNGVKELTDSGQRFYRSGVIHAIAAYNPIGAIYYFAAQCALENPYLALAVKLLCYMLAGFFFAAAAHFLKPPVSRLELPLEVRGFHLLREFLFSLGFLLVVLLVSEPFLAQESQKGGFSLRLNLPITGGTVAAGIAGIKQTVMNPTILLTLLVFFVLQALIYISCLVKLAEIRRQQIPPRMKLKLLENEDHLFDAGLYLGFVGTIVSLIIASMGLVKFSLMAAYSSTSFGIIFVVIFKIFHLRPARRKLLMEAELAEATAVRTTGGTGAGTAQPAYSS